MHQALLAAISDRIGSKSGVLATLERVCVALVAALVGLALAHAETWVMVFVAVLLGLSFVVFLGLYVRISEKSPDALRSEKYALRSKALGTLVGDDASGLHRRIRLDDGDFVLGIEPTSDRLLSGSHVPLLDALADEVTVDALPAKSEKGDT